jgi:general nucleoside transport system permease protein
MTLKKDKNNPEIKETEKLEPELTIHQKAPRSYNYQSFLIPILAVLTGLIIGAFFIVFTDLKVLPYYQQFFKDPLTALLVSWQAVVKAYGALFAGSLGSLPAFIAAIKVYSASGDPSALYKAIYPFTESLVASSPYILTGLAVAVGFRGGLFNIGAEGQFFMGALGSAFVGYSLKGVSPVIHLPLALLGGAIAGGAWAFLPGFLKAKTGAHEVVTTIMMNWIAFRLSDWLLNGPMKATGYRPLTPVVEESAMLPRFFPDPLRFNWGFFLALGIAFFIWWLLFKTTVGYEIRSVGANPNAAKYAGMNISNNIILIMVVSGALAGLGGAVQVLGTDHWVGQGFSAGFGFDAIALALIGNSHPLGVVLAALLFGVLRGGATSMQSLAGIPIDIISVIQGLVIVFIAAPVIIRAIYRVGTPHKEEVVHARGWK